MQCKNGWMYMGTMSLAGLHNLVSLPFFFPTAAPPAFVPYILYDSTFVLLLNRVVKIPPGGTDKREITKALGGRLNNNLSIQVDCVWWLVGWLAAVALSHGWLPTRPNIYRTAQNSKRIMGQCYLAMLLLPGGNTPQPRFSVHRRRFISFVDLLLIFIDFYVAT